MRLKDLRINQVSFFYSNYQEEVEEVDEDGNFTGDTVGGYENPVRGMARISPNSGEAAASPFGAELKYDKQMSSVKKYPLDEQTRLFIDIEPVLNEDGSTDTSPDYKVVAVANDLQQNVWALRRIG